MVLGYVQSRSFVIGAKCKIYQTSVAFGRITESFSGFSDATCSQGFSPGGHERLLLLIIGCLIYKSWVDGAGALVGDGLSVKGLEHWVTGVQRLPVAILKQQQELTTGKATRVFWWS